MKVFGSMQRFFFLVITLSWLMSNTVAYATESLTYTVLYTGEDNHTYFKKSTEPMHPNKVGNATFSLRAKELVFGSAPEGEESWHNTPKRMFIVVLSGVMQIQASCGQVRNFAAGEFLLVEDFKGRGHITRGLKGAPVRYMTIEL
jgi:hypothetical protein